MNKLVRVKNCIRLAFKSVKKIEDGLNFIEFGFDEVKTNDNSVIRPLQVVQLKVMNLDSDLTMERYYSVLSLPKFPIDADSSIKFLIRDNKDIVDNSYCFPFRLRHPKNNDIIQIIYPFGNTSYEGNGMFKYNDELIKPKVLITITCGTGAVPIAGLLEDMLEGNEKTGLALYSFDCDQNEETLLQKCINETGKEIFKVLNERFVIVQDYHKSISELLLSLSTNMPKILNDFKEEDIFFIICGSEQMKKDVENHLKTYFSINIRNLSSLF